MEHQQQTLTETNRIALDLAVEHCRNLQAQADTAPTQEQPVEQEYVSSFDEHMMRLDAQIKRIEAVKQFMTDYPKFHHRHYAMQTACNVAKKSTSNLRLAAMEDAKDCYGRYKQHCDLAYEVLSNTDRVELVELPEFIWDDRYQALFGEFEETNNREVYKCSFVKGDRYSEQTFEIDRPVAPYYDF